MSTMQDMFVEQFRASAPYIHAHRGSTFVVVFGGELLQSPGLRAFLYDVSLLHTLGVRLVLVAGARPQIDEALARRGQEPVYVNDLRVTDDTALQCVKEAAGTTRVELESLLSMGLPNSPMAGAQIRVVSGNFVKARPVGVIDGVDYMHTGTPRKVDTEALTQRLDDRAIVVLTPIGYSATGEAFNMSSYEVASRVAIELGADKLIGLIEADGVVDDTGTVRAQLSPAAAVTLLDTKTELGPDVGRQIRAAVAACEGGVRRAHLISRHADGALLRELFTRDGAGTLVTAQAFEGTRAAEPSDIVGLLELLEPLETAGVLVRRSRQMLENDIDKFMVVERDGMVIACAAIYPYKSERTAELACFVVHPQYRQAGRGDALLQSLERGCLSAGLDRVFVLTTQTSQWFAERGFVPCELDALPEERRPHYDRDRRSRILMKTLG